MAALKGSISGDSFDLPLPDSLLHPLERMAPSGPWVFPHPNVWRDKVRDWLQGSTLSTGGATQE